MKVGRPRSPVKGGAQWHLEKDWVPAFAGKPCRLGRDGRAR
jgi:hypothetical protein